jgi:hypothetical protein
MAASNIFSGSPDIGSSSAIPNKNVFKLLARTIS